MSPPEGAADEAERPPPSRRRRRRGPKRWAWLGVLAAVVAVQLGLSAAAFHPAPHSGGDNAGYLTLAYSLVERGAYLDLYDPAATAHTKYPPVYPAVLALAMLLGAREWATFKLVSLGATTLTVILVFLWSRERRPSLAFAAALAALVAVSDAVLWGSRWILSDPLFVALTFLALWAFARVDRLAEPAGGGERSRPGGGGRSEAEAEGGGSLAGGPLPWLVLGGAATVLAYFTRSAGLPLVVAVGAWMLLRRRRAALGAFAAAFGLPALLWWLRGRSVAEGAYLSEFWMVNPYRPELGAVGPGGLVERVLENVELYVGTFFPRGIVGEAGAAGAALPFIGGVLTLLAVVGWGRRIRAGAGVAELFTLLYLGLILLWPQVWSSDRFALPLYPLLLFYAGEAVAEGAVRLHPRGPVVAGAVAVALLSLPALATWRGTLDEARSCRLAAGTGNVWGCYPAGVQEFAAAARWSAANLPEGAAVLSRKPRIFYVTSGLRSRTYPFTPEPDTLLAEARATGSRYVILDRVGVQAGRYLAPAIRARPGAFCSLEGFGEAGRARTELLGILPRDAWTEEAAGEGDRVEIRVCPPAMRRPEAEEASVEPSSAVPLLRGLDG